MRDERVSYKLALLAKEKGFEFVRTTYYYANENKISHRDFIPHDFNIRGLLSAPSLSLLQRWLREKKK